MYFTFPTLLDLKNFQTRLVDIQRFLKGYLYKVYTYIYYCHV